MPSLPQGIGLGLRAPFLPALLADPPDELRWLELCPENYLHRGGFWSWQLARCAERWPLVTHGLTLSVGGPDPLDEAYLRDVSRFAEEVRTPWHSDHLCFGSVDGVHLHELLPLPFTRESVRHVAARVERVRRALGERPFALENVSYYAHPGRAEMDEATFLREVLEATGAGLLLDLNNVVVNARNHGFDPREFVASLPLERVVQLHVAGHQVQPDGLRLDTHGEPVGDEVYALLAFTLRLTGPLPVLLERDRNLPPFDSLVAEVRALDALWRHATGTDPTAPLARERGP